MSESIGIRGKGMKLHTKILLGLVVGAVARHRRERHARRRIIRRVDVVNKYLAGPVGQIFLRMLFMIVMPLVFASIALGVAGLGDLRNVGRVGAKAIGVLPGHHRPRGDARADRSC